MGFSSYLKPVERLLSEDVIPQNPDERLLRQPNSQHGIIRKDP